METVQLPRARAPWRVLVLFALATLLFTGHSRALPPDPAARGLDLFIHVANEAAPGGIIELTAEAFGFATVAAAQPLPGATVEAGWDPESLGGVAAPPTVSARTDAEGRARLAIQVPPGGSSVLSLLVGARHGGHSRTHTVSVARSPASHVELHVADRRVVPMSTISAWARVAGISGKPLAGVPVTVSLLEGGVARYKERLVSDRGGLVMARVPIPRVDEPVWQWTLLARPEVAKGESAVGAAGVELIPREEIPGMPKLEASWEPSATGAFAGDRIPYSIRVRDATGQPLIDHPWLSVFWRRPPSSFPRRRPSCLASSSE
ncbi:MAG: Large extracellular alpha-helical protein [Labilithrix sp.]|nr:Large extracellular alpha-helical protein [Labilithrix sp.]